LFSAYSDRWALFRYEMSGQQPLSHVGETLAFAGNASWANDDSWIVFIGKVGDKNFQIARLGWGGAPELLEIPESLSEKYPVISPTDGRLAFACKDSDRWNLCTADSSGQGFKLEIENVLINNKRTDKKPVIPEVTPSWSPDGNWIALALQGQDSDWDIVLYSPALNIRYNLTAALPGNQFEPSWSKP
jgi:Tol biopolymer transport system component